MAVGRDGGVLMAKKPDRPVGPIVDPQPPGSKPDMRPLHGRG